jgi:hypothetical protein
VLLEPEETQGREGMSKRRWIISIVVLLAAIPAATSALATASPLLSGYGSPGEGNQAILGAALLNGPKGGGGSGGASAAGGGSSGSNAGSAVTGVTPTRSGKAVSTTSTARRHAPAGRRTPQQKRGVAGRPASAPLYPASATGSTVGSEPAGLSGQDFVYILVGLGVLIFTGLITRRLARAGQRAGTGS